MKLAFAAAVLASVFASAHFAQTVAEGYLSNPIRVVVPSPPSGRPDLIMRMLGPKISASMGQQLVVDNRPGAGGVVGSNAVAKSQPDGYTWLFYHRLAHQQAAVQQECAV